MMQDPLGYYSCLGVQPNAPAAVIRAAYRALAQEYHPDRNKAADATRKFQELQRAYEVLSDPVERANYDASATSRAEQAPPSDAGPSGATAQNEASSAYEPIRCVRCNSISAIPRYRVFYTVVGYVIGATRTPSQGAYCKRCEAVVGLRCTGITMILGWWSLHGFIWSLDAVLRNIFWARQYLEQTARLLAHQTGYFLATGNQQLAYAVALEALETSIQARQTSPATRRREKLGYGESDPITENIEHLTSFIRRGKENGFAGPPLKESLGFHSPAFRLQAGLLAAVIAVLSGWVWVDHEQSVRAEQQRLEAAGMARARAEAIARSREQALAALLQPLPPNGWSEGGGYRNHPGLKVIAPSSANAIVKLTVPGSQETVATLFVRAGQSAETTVPPGTYEVKIASGQQWYGDEVRFGPDTSYSKVPQAVSFRIEGSQLLGHEINLNLVRDGNLHTQNISASQF